MIHELRQNNYKENNQQIVRRRSNNNIESETKLIHFWFNFYNIIFIKATIFLGKVQIREKNQTINYKSLYKINTS